MEETDVMVIGGGPAGAAAAITLAKSGMHCVLIEKRAEPAWKIGETLAPESRQILQELGVWDQFSKDGHRVSPGNGMAWGSNELSFKDFIYNPHGSAWQLDRIRFETSLLNAASAAGAKVLRGVALQKIQRGAMAWEVALEKVSFKVKWLIDASGRGAQVARHFGILRTMLDKLVAVYTVASSGENTDVDARTYVEACRDGWWYSALIPAYRRVFVYLTDADFLPGHEWRDMGWFRQRLEETVHIRRLMESGNCSFDNPPELTSAHSGKLENCHGDGWLAVGDAAQSYDPLSGEGLFHALLSGCRAAKCLTRHLSGSDNGMSEYAELNTMLWERFLHNRHICYMSESRWHDEPFWQRRHAPN